MAYTYTKAGYSWQHANIISIRTRIQISYPYLHIYKYHFYTYVYKSHIYTVCTHDADSKADSHTEAGLSIKDKAKNTLQTIEDMVMDMAPDEADQVHVCLYAGMHMYICTRAYIRRGK